MNHFKWDEVAKGFNTPTMHRTLKVIGWLAKGYSIPMAGRVVAMVSSNAGTPYLGLRATSHSDGKELDAIMLGMDPDIGIFVFIRERNIRRGLGHAARERRSVGSRVQKETLNKN